MNQDRIASRPCIGIHVHGDPDGLRATLASLVRNTVLPFDVLLLPDGPDEAIQAELAKWTHLRQSATSEALGAPACFNRLLTASDADVVVFLESGAVVGPSWLDHLLKALDADPSNGLAGPSTNRAWNEQAVHWSRDESSAEVDRVAGETERRFGFAWRTLEPLYSLADFCYAVRRDVALEIGGADEAYGLGPCWEMDYNVRAARAGFRGVWACSAYVHRAAPTARRQLEEALRFEASKRLYQDRFCGGRLRREKFDYRPHCRGDSCPNFAPAVLIGLRQPVIGLDRRYSSLAAGEFASRSRPHHHEPLVTCIMPTYNRRAFVPQAIRCFLRQDYGNAELLILDDGTDPVGDCVPEDPRIRYIRLEGRSTIGAKRNVGCAQSRSEFILHWDDDDWYPPWRIRAQLSVLRNGSQPVCGTSRVLFYEGATDQTWEYRYAAPEGPDWVAGTTLGYRKSFWESNRFPDIQIGEDFRFVSSCPPGALADLADPSLCVAVVHPGNTSPKQSNCPYWHPLPSSRIHELLGDDLYFYRRPQSGAGSDAWPLVSCIMLTHDRRAFLPLALRGFLSQDYPNKELIIVDDGTDAVGDLVEGHANVRYIRLAQRTSIGEKRNVACQHARGDIIAHCDDDDWYAPDRLRYQVAPIVSNQADITGLDGGLMLELPSGAFWTVQARLHERMFRGNVHGGTLVFRKELFALGLRFPPVDLAEDAALLQQALAQGRRLMRLANPGVFVYVRHRRNAWQFETGRFLDPALWVRIERPKIFSANALASYQRAAA